MGIEKTNDLGVYLQVFRNNGNPEFALKNFRKFYPDNPIYLLSDNGDDFSILCKRYNCVYEYSNYNTGVKPVGFNLNEFIEWLNRFKRCCESFNTKFILNLEDDVFIKNKISFDTDTPICGFYARKIPDSIIKYLSNKYKTSKFNTNMYGACGGTFYNRLCFLNNFDKMISFLNSEFDYIRLNISDKICFLDITMCIIYMYLGYGYYEYKECAGTVDNPNWRLKNYSLIHIQKTHIEDRSQEIIMKEFSG